MKKEKEKEKEKEKLHLFGSCSFFLFNFKKKGN
jgi:hypothetical protein